MTRRDSPMDEPSPESLRAGERSDIAPRSKQVARACCIWVDALSFGAVVHASLARRFRASGRAAPRDLSGFDNQRAGSKKANANKRRLNGPKR